MEQLKERLLVETGQQDVHTRKANQVWVSPTACEALGTDYRAKMSGRDVAATRRAEGKREKRAEFAKVRRGHDFYFVRKLHGDGGGGRKKVDQATLTLCPQTYTELIERGRSTLKAQEEAVQNALARREELALQSAARTEEYKQVKEIITQDKLTKRTKHDAIVSNAKKAIIDNEEEMKDFYATLGASQALAMRQKQIIDKQHFKELGLYNFEAYNTAPTVQDAAEAEYNELKARREQIYEKNRKVLDVLKFQWDDSEMKRKQKQWDNEEQAHLEKKAAEESMKRQLDYQRKQAAEDDRNAEIFRAIQIHNNAFMKSIRAQDDKFAHQREKDFLKAKAEFNRKFEEKRKRERDRREKQRSLVTQALSETQAELEKADYEANYVILTEKANQQRDEEIQTKLFKKLERVNLQKDWEKIRLANQKVKDENIQQGQEEQRRLNLVAENESVKAGALQKKRLVEKDIARMEILHQINERDKLRKNERSEILRETSLLRAQEFLRQAEIKSRMQEKLEQIRQAGLPLGLVDTIGELYKL